MMRLITFAICGVIALTGAISSFIIGIDSYGEGSTQATASYLCLGLFGASAVMWITFMLCNDIQDTIDKHNKQSKGE